MNTKHSGNCEWMDYDAQRQECHLLLTDPSVPEWISRMYQADETGLLKLVNELTAHDISEAPKVIVLARILIDHWQGDEELRQKMILSEAWGAFTRKFSSFAL